VTVVVLVETILLGEDEITMSPGESMTLTLSFSPADAEDYEIRYSSSDDRIAAVSDDGTITAVGTGTATIRISVNGAEVELTIIVIESVRNISVSTDRRTFKVGDQGRFTVRILPETASDATYTVSIRGNSIVHTEGNTFSCIASGDATITVTAANGVTGTHTITVVDLAELAEEVFRLTNHERDRAGLPLFRSNAPLTLAAEVRANEIIRHFSHTRPDGRDCFTAFDESDVDYRTAGENLAAGQRTPADAVRGWMNSPGHRENIMNRSFGQLGIGVAMDNTGRLYWTQTFTD
jgi:uncharacterized protein YkwD